MTCTACREPLEVAAQFCSSCGAPTRRNATCRPANDINSFWLEDALKERGYSIQVDARDANAWRATAPNRPTFEFAYSVHNKLVVFMVEKVPEDRSPMGKIKGFQYINSANNGLSFWKARWDDRDNTIYFTFILSVADHNTRERIHAIACPVLDEMIECSSPSSSS